MNQLVENRASILVVDDNPLIVNVLKGLLGSEKYQVYTSNNGQEAVTVLENKNIDVIICDVMMPTMNGYELHDYVRAKAELSHIPFVFLTALGDSQDVSQGREMGADDYIVKPFDPRDLLSVVKGKVVRSKNIKSCSEEKYEKYRKKVIHTLSHEFRTPLVAINTGAELLIDQDKKLDVEKTKNLLEAIRRGGQRLERLVNDFMLLQQVEAGIAQRLFDTRASALKLGEIVRQFVEAKEGWITSERGQVSFSDLSDGARTLIYEPHIHDILNRLVSNALKFSEEAPRIKIDIYRQESELVVSVRDWGIGIDVEKVQEAIDLFGQIDRDRLEQQGGGLGLAIANRYAAINKGRIEFERAKDKGSIVSLVLPIAI